MSNGLTDILGVFGLTGAIAEAFAIAEFDPTSHNVQAVVDAYAANAQVIPTKMLAYLVQQNEMRHPEDLYRSSLVPWLVLGAGVFAFFMIRKRKRG